MRKFIFIGLFLCSFFHCYGQQAVDSILAQLNVSLPDTVRANKLVSLGKLLIDNNPDTVRLIAQEAIALSENIAFNKGMLMGYNLLGNVVQRKGEVDSAMYFYNKVKELAEQEDDIKGLAIAYNNIGIIHTNKGEYSAALSSYLKAFDFEKQLNDSLGMAEAYNNIGVVHYYMGDMENTLTYFKKSTELTKAIGDLQILKKGYINIGAIHQYRKEYEEALEFYQKGLDIALEVDDHVDINLSRHNMAQIHISRKEFDKAEAFLKSSLDFQKKIRSMKGIAFDYTNLGSLYREKQEYEKAKEYFFKAIDLSRRGGFLKELETTYGELADMYAKNGQYERAYKSAKDYITLKDSLLNQENARNFAELRTKYETAEKEKALAEEKIKSESLAKEAAEAKLSIAKRNIGLIIISALAIGVVLLMIARSQRNKRKAQAEQDAAIIMERDKGTKAILEAQEEERKRISKDLHDGVGQQLSGLKMGFQKIAERIKLDNPERSRELHKLSTILSESADEIRSISHRMMPKTLTEIGLVEALQDMLHKTFNFSDITYEFEHYGIEQRLPEQYEISLYRVAQELINNIIKHAKASKVNVQLFKNSGKLIMVVEDDGKGIEDNLNDGHGLLNMRSRINTLNGELNLEPSPNCGTLATIRIPMA